MSKNVIFCFSGTGNCLDLARNIARGLGNTDIIIGRTCLSLLLCPPLWHGCSWY